MFKLYYCTGDLLHQVQQFEKSLVIDITEASNKIQNTNGSVFCQYKKLLLTSTGCADLENLVASFQRGMYTRVVIIIIMLRENKLSNFLFFLQRIRQFSIPL